MGPLVSLHDELVRSGDEHQPVRVVELLRDVLLESPASVARVATRDAGDRIIVMRVFLAHISWYVQQGITSCWGYLSPCCESKDISSLVVGGSMSGDLAHLYKLRQCNGKGYHHVVVQGDTVTVRGDGITSCTGDTAAAKRSRHAG